MRAYRLRTVTVGLRERIARSGHLGCLIVWSWWAVWPLRLRWLRAAHEEAGRHFAWESPKRGGGRPAPVETLACELVVVTGHGTPDEWRRVRLRDALYILDYSTWVNTLKKDRGPLPVWGKSPDEVTPGIVGGPEVDPRFRRVG